MCQNKTFSTYFSLIRLLFSVTLNDFSLMVYFIVNLTLNHDLWTRAIQMYLYIVSNISGTPHRLNVFHFQQIDWLIWNILANQIARNGKYWVWGITLEVFCYVRFTCTLILPSHIWPYMVSSLPYIVSPLPYMVWGGTLSI